MSKKPMADIGASIRERLKHKADRLGYDFQVLLIHYALERLLYRLGRSKYYNRFLLKGALLFEIWYGQMVRSSMDADMLGKGSSDVQSIIGIFREICQIKVDPDGLEFLVDTVRGQEILENSEYQGVRVTLTAMLSGARIYLQVDVGFGDAVVPQPKNVKYPALLDFSAPSIKAYTPYTVIAEKFQTIVDKGLANSRMKDYYDIWYISRHSNLDGLSLSKAIAATFKRRRTALPESLPEGLGDYFAEDKDKRRQWTGFLKKSKPNETCELDAAIKEIRMLLIPVVQSLIEKKPFNKVWHSSQGWR